MHKSIVIAAGGTGGHLFPAQSLANELTKSIPDSSISFMAKGLNTNPRYQKNYPAFDITASGIGLKALYTIPKGVIESIFLLKKQKPDLVIGFGSFHTFPVLVAAVLLRIPIILHEANRKPGKVNRLLAPYAAFSGIYFPDTKLRGTVVKADIPLRLQFAKEMRPTKDAAYKRYGLDPNKKTVLVFGGSLGARQLNHLAASALVKLTDAVQVVHFTGSSEQVEVVAPIYKEAHMRAFVHAFEEEMSYAWRVADLVIARAGASTIAEQIASGVPALFIPYPYAADNHQEENAQFVTDVLGGGSMLRESGLSIERLSLEIDTLLRPEVHEKMQKQLIAAQTSMKCTPFIDHILGFLKK